MSSSVKEIAIRYDPINEWNTFSGGDFISGRVLVILSKETKIESLSVKAKGKAEVRWTESHGDERRSYHAKHKLFRLEQSLMQKGEDSIVLTAGSHEYNFTFQIPHGNMPSSFKGAHGEIIYTLEAKLSRAWRLSSKDKSTFTYLSNAAMNTPQLMIPQSGKKEKKLRLLTSGNISMNVNLEKMGYLQGERLTVMVELDNSSSRDLVVKFSVDQVQTFIAQSSKNYIRKCIIKEETPPVSSKTKQTITKVLTIPPDLSTSILNCPILIVEYTLKVYLDVPYASDPEVKFPLVILPACCAFGQLTQPNMSSDFPPQPWSPPQAAPIVYPAPPVPGTYPAPPVPGTYPAPPFPGTYPAPPFPGTYPAPHVPGTCPAPPVPGTYPAPHVPGTYQNQPVPGTFPLQMFPDSYPTQTPPGTFPPQTAPPSHPNQLPPGGHAPHTGPGTFPPQVVGGLYPTLNDFGGKALQ